MWNWLAEAWSKEDLPTPLVGVITELFVMKVYCLLRLSCYCRGCDVVLLAIYFLLLPPVAVYPPPVILVLPEAKTLPLVFCPGDICYNCYGFLLAVAAILFSCVLLLGTACTVAILADTVLIDSYEESSHAIRFC